MRAAVAVALAMGLAFGANARGPEGQTWDFTLPTLDGDRFLSLGRIRGPVLVNFWGRDCPPCIAELPRLQAFALQHPEWTVLLVSTDVPAVARRALSDRGIALPAVRAGANVAGLMRAAGNVSGGLPYSVAVNGAVICRAMAGELSAEDLGQWARACSPGDARGGR
ncbi:TlpA family protein disulfide reductase [Variovorax boronicumulans]|uniref:TlpA family protein disulfide reductase n=1 Tax=Variovorax boronicumulans TaxID=436515 RepID=UPI003396B36F